MSTLREVRCVLMYTTVCTIVRTPNDINHVIGNGEPENRHTMVNSEDDTTASLEECDESTMYTRMQQVH